MVQVDVFWSYGFGTGFALAASEQLARAPARERSFLADEHFARNLLFLAVIFAPSGACLLWAFPSWETMHAGDRDLPAWLVTLFAATNVTQGVLGWWVARRLILAGNRFAAYLHWLAAYFAMFFILVHGWDGTGYQRFFSSRPEQLVDWHWGRVLEFLRSDVALTLYAMGVVLIPIVLGWTSEWLRTGALLREVASGKPEAERRPPPSRLHCWRFALSGIFGLGLGGAILASLLIHALGWVFGALVFGGFTVLIGVPFVCTRHYARVFGSDR
jgi:hypothetical protein